ncbi:reticulocyte binding protein 2a [Plasmodium gonderi]|uniref:Reticulocyte binding protein 2a n=1 Tax=Plasmodium gonderi TaxID=77519 RepID=A0A1Y1JTH3_PLAGO|nr:reticulocyte binding protein 2a [Plasmodium gonderi]GAW83224.1 reticulocyte binding protein 2a [Plasmodium gonderi]
MKKYVYFLSLLNLLLASFVHMNTVSSQNKNYLEEIKKHNTELNNLFEFSNISENKNVKSSKYLNDKINDKQFEKIYNQNDNIIHSLEAMSFINLNGPNITENNKNGIYKKRRNPYYFIRRYKEKKKAYGELNKSGKKIIENGEITSKYENFLNDGNIKYDQSNPIFTMELDYTNLHALHEIEILIPKDKLHHEKTDDTIVLEIKKFSDELEELINNCLNHKSMLKSFTYEMEFLKNTSTENKLFSEHFLKELETRIINLDNSKKVLYKEYTTEKFNHYTAKYNECLSKYEQYREKYKNDIQNKVEQIKNKAFTYLIKTECVEGICDKNKSTYLKTLDNYILDISTVNMKDYDIPSRITVEQKNVDQLLLDSNKKNIDISEDIYSLKLILEQIKEIEYVLSTNRHFINEAARKLRSIEITQESHDVNKKEIVSNWTHIVKQHCIFKYINKLNESINVMYQHKITKHDLAFHNLVNTIKQKAYLVFSETFDQTEIYKNYKYSEEIINNENKKYLESKKELEKVSQFPDISNNSNKQKLMEHFVKQKARKKDIEAKFQLLDEIYKKIYDKLKNHYEEELNEIEKLNNNITKAQLFMDVITKINEEKKVNIYHEMKKFKIYYDELVTLKNSANKTSVQQKNNISLLQISSEENDNENNDSKSDENESNDKESKDKAEFLRNVKALYRNLKAKIKNFEQKHQDIVEKMKSYKDFEETIQKYYAELTQNESNYFLTSYTGSNAKSKSNESEAFNEAKDTFQKKKLEIYNSIDNMKTSDIVNIKKHLDSYKEIEKKLNIIKNTRRYNKIKTLVQEINNENVEEKIQEFEKNYNTSTNNMEETLKKIELLNKIINLYNILDSSITESKSNKALTDNLNNKLNELKGHVETRIRENEGNDFINKSIKEEALENLQKTLKNLEITLKDIVDLIAEIKNKELEKKTSELIEFYLNLKNKIHETKDEYSSKTELERTDEWTPIRQELNTLNEKYSILYENSYKLFANIDVQIITWSYNIVKEEIKRLENENDTIESFVINLEKKLNEEQTNPLTNKIMKIQNIGSIKNFKQKIKDENTKIEKYKDELTELQDKADELYSESQEEKIAIHELNNQKKGMKSIYDDLVKMSKDIKITVDYFNEVSKNINEAQLNEEKDNIDKTLKALSDDMTKAQKSMEDINSLEIQFKELIEKSKYPEDKILPILKYSTQVEEANKHMIGLKQVYETSVKLKEQANASTSLDEIIEKKKQINENKHESKKLVADIDKAISEIKNICELTHRGYKSIVNNITKNTDDADKHSELIKSEFNKSHNAAEVVKTDFQKATKLKEEINEKLNGVQIDNKIIEIQKLKTEILNKKQNAIQLLTDTELHRKKTELHYDNANRGQAIIEYLKNNDNDIKTKILQNELDQVKQSIEKANGYYKDSLEYTQNTKTNYELISKLEADVSKLLNESLINRVTLKCERRKNRANSVMTEINNIASKIEKTLKGYKTKIHELKEQSNIQMIENEKLNDMSLNAYNVMQKYNHELDEILNKIKRIENIIQRYVDRASSSIKSISSITDIDIKDFINQSKLVDDDFERNVEKVSREKRHIDVKKKNIENEEKKIDLIKNEITTVEKEIGKHKKYYEEGIIKQIIKNVSEHVNAVPLIINEIDSLITPATSIFIKYKTKKYDPITNLNGYKIQRDQLYNKFDTSYKLMEKYQTDVSHDSVTYADAKDLRIKTQDIEKNLKESTEELRKLLNDIKKKEIINFLNSMKENLNRKHENIKKEESKEIEQLKSVKKLIQDLKALKEGEKNFDALIETKKKSINVKNPKHLSHRDEAKKIYENMIDAINYLLIDKNSVKLEKNLNSELNFETNLGIQAEIHNIIKEAQQVTNNIHDISDNIDDKNEECENLILEAENIYTAIKLRNEFYSKEKETRKKEISVSEKIDSLQSKLRDIEKITCNYVGYEDILQNDKRFETFKNNATFYQQKKSVMAKEAELHHMRQNMQKHKESLNSLLKSVKELTRKKFHISIWQNYKNQIELIFGNINTIDNKAKEFDASFDELQIMGNNCQELMISIISNVVNNGISNHLMKIEAQNKNIESVYLHVKENYDSMKGYINALHTFYNKTVINNDLSISINAYNQSFKNFKEQEKKAAQTIDNIKIKLNSLQAQSSENNIERDAKELITLYKNLQSVKAEIGKIFRNLNNIKLSDIDKTSDIFKDAVALHKNMITSQNQQILEREGKLKNIENSITSKINDINKISNIHTHETKNVISELYNNIKSDIQNFNQLDGENVDRNFNSEKYKEQVTYLIDRTNFFLNNLQLFKKDDYYNLVGENVEETEKETTLFTDITQKLNNLKKEYQKILDTLEQNDDAISRMTHYKQSANQNYENVTNLYETYLKELSEMDLINKIREIIKEINNIIKKDLQEHKVLENLTKISESIKTRKNNTQNYETIEDVEKAIIQINSENTELNSTKIKIINVLDIVTVKENTIKGIFDGMVKDNIQNKLEHVKSDIDDVLKKISELKDAVKNIDELLHHNATQMKELEAQKEKLEMLSKNLESNTTVDHSTIDENYTSVNDNAPETHVIDESIPEEQRSVSHNKDIPTSNVVDEKDTESQNESQILEQQNEDVNSQTDISSAEGNVTHDLQEIKEVVHQEVGHKDIPISNVVDEKDTKSENESEPLEQQNEGIKSQTDISSAEGNVTHDLQKIKEIEHEEGTHKVIPTSKPDDAEVTKSENESQILEQQNEGIKSQRNISSADGNVNHNLKEIKEVVHQKVGHTDIHTPKSGDEKVTNPQSETQALEQQNKSINSQRDISSTNGNISHNLKEIKKVEHHKGALKDTHFNKIDNLNTSNPIQTQDLLNLPENTEYEKSDDDNFEESNFEDKEKHNSHKKAYYEKIFFATGITTALLSISSVSYFIYNKNNEENKDSHFYKGGDEFEYESDTMYDNKEQVIDVAFSEDSDI